MESNQLTSDIQVEVENLIGQFGREKVEISILRHLTNCRPEKKSVIWSDADPDNVKQIYLTLAHTFFLPYDSASFGCYLYVNVKN